MFPELESVIKNEYGNINGIVVTRNGAVLYERYFNGYGPDDAHHIASVTKSVISALVGIAIDEGLLRSADQKVLDFFPEYAPDAVGGCKQEITLRHLLTMTAPYQFEDWHEPLDRMCMQPDWVKYALDLLGKNGKIGAFKYSTAGAHLLSAVITKAVGKSAREFANERLFGPVGMRTIPDHEMKAFGIEDLFGKEMKGWVKDPDGNSTGGWGLMLTPRDMTRFGQLYLNRGLWNGLRIVSEAWVAESTAINANGYGYLWWLFEEDGISAYAALGDGGNAIFCIPGKGLTVAVASSFIMEPRDRWTLVKEHILPAL